MKVEYSCILSSYDKTEWIEKIFFWSKTIKGPTAPYNTVEIQLGPKVVKHKFLPFHIVTLSCFIELLKREGWIVFLIIDRIVRFHSHAPLGRIFPGKV